MKYEVQIYTQRVVFSVSGPVAKGMTLFLQPIADFWKEDNMVLLADVKSGARKTTR